MRNGTGLGANPLATIFGGSSAVVEDVQDITSSLRAISFGKILVYGGIGAAVFGFLFGVGFWVAAGVTKR